MFANGYTYGVRRIIESGFAEIGTRRVRGYGLIRQNDGVIPGSREIGPGDFLVVQLVADRFKRRWRQGVPAGERAIR